MKPEVWKQEIEQWGVLRWMYAGLMRQLKPLLTVCRIHLRAHYTDNEPITHPGFDVRIASRNEVLRAAENPDMGIDARNATEALARGDFCSAAFAGDKMVSYVWRSFTGAPHTKDIWVHVQSPYRYGYKAFTLPEYRGRHLQDPIALLTDRFCIERGYTHALGFIETHNYPSIASDLRRGNVLIGWAGYIRLPGGYLTFRTPGVKKHHFRFCVREPTANMR